MKGEELQGQILGGLKTERWHGKTISAFPPVLFLGEGLTFCLGRRREHSAEPGQAPPGAVEADACFCRHLPGMGYATNGRGWETPFPWGRCGTAGGNAGEQRLLPADAALTTQRSPCGPGAQARP